MTDTPEQAQLRQHLAELRQAAHAIGRDAELHVLDIPRKIDRLGTKAGKDAKYAYWELEDDLSAFEHALKKDIKSVPGRIRDGAETAASSVAGAVGGAASWTSEKISNAGHRAAEGTRNAFASAAGVKRTPMKAWHPPSGRPPVREEE
jgi:hypothetical protein